MFPSLTPISDRYFESSRRAEEAMKDNILRGVAMYEAETLSLVPGFVEEQARDFGGTFPIGTISSIEDLLRYYPILGNPSGIDRVRAIIDSIPLLRKSKWSILAGKAERDLEIRNRLLEHIRDHPGVIQSSLANILNCDGNDSKQILYYLDKLGYISRVKSGRSLALYIRAPTDPKSAIA